MPMGKIVAESSRLVNEHPLGLVTLFDATTITFFSGRTSYIHHCDGQGSGKKICWRCRFRAPTPFALDAPLYWGRGHGTAPGQVPKAVQLVQKPFKHGICPTCRAPKPADDQVLVVF